MDIDPRHVVATFDFSAHAVIADIGGGTGAVLATILKATPNAHGILFDQPHVVAGAAGVLTDAGVDDRVEVVAGSFFESVPAGADLYVMRRILHDWDDQEAAKS